MVATRKASTEAEIWARFKAGDRRASDELAVLYYPKVQESARIIGRRRRVHPDDIVGEGAVAMMQAMKRFDPSRGFLFWTFAERTVRGAMIRAIQGRMPTVTDVSRGEPLPETPAATADLDVLAQRREAFDAAMHGMDDEARAVVLLALVEDMNDEEIARVLGSTAKAVSAVRHQAIDALRPDRSSTPGLWR